jgi:hypothetical protein
VLERGDRIDLRSGLPPEVRVLVASNVAERHGHYRLASAPAGQLRAYVEGLERVLVVGATNAVARAIRAQLGRRIPLWEGYVRDALSALVLGVQEASGDAPTVADHLLAFLGEVGTGFTASGDGASLLQDVRDGCTRARRGKPLAVQPMAVAIVDSPDHRGVAKAIAHLRHLRRTDGRFSEINFDHAAEVDDAIALGTFDDMNEGMEELQRRRTAARRQPPVKAVSTVHKAKGLETAHAILVACDSERFPDKGQFRCLLYVALSRAMEGVTLVVCGDKPSPLVRL